MNAHKSLEGKLLEVRINYVGSDESTYQQVRELPVNLQLSLESQSADGLTLLVQKDSSNGLPIFFVRPKNATLSEVTTARGFNSRKYSFGVITFPNPMAYLTIYKKIPHVDENKEAIVAIFLKQ